MEAANIIKQIINAVHACHDNHVTHRDIKVRPRAAPAPRWHRGYTVGGQQFAVVYKNSSKVLYTPRPLATAAP